jgi:hypothetical protein
MEIWANPGAATTPSQEPRGSEANPYPSLSEAVAAAGPGDRVIAKPGIYRETVRPPKGGEEGRCLEIVSLIPQGARVRGSDVILEDPLPPGVHLVPLAKAAPPGPNPFAIKLAGSRIGGCCGQLYVGEQMLREVGREEDLRRSPGTWMTRDQGQAAMVHISALDEPGPLEAVFRTRLFEPASRGLGWITLEGFVFERCANQSAASFWEEDRVQQGAVGLGAGHHFIIRGCTIRDAKTIGLDLGIGGGAERTDGIVPHDNLIEGCRFLRNGEVGACGQRSHRTIVRDCLVEGNACLGLHTVEEAGLKFHEFYDGVIENCVVQSNEAAGIWLDAMWAGARISRCLVVNNVGSGIFMELGSDGAMVDHNIVACTRLGDGIYSHDGSDVTYAHNLVFGCSHFGLYLRYVTDRPFPHKDGVTRPAQCSRNRVVNNLFIDNYRGPICMPANSERSTGNLSEHNHFINGTQWQWEGLPFHQFCLGDNDGDLTRETLDAALTKAGLPAGTGPSMTLEQWQKLGWDRTSFAPEAFRITKENGAVVKGTASFGMEDSHFTLRLGPEAVSPLVPRLEECPEDFKDRPRGDLTSPGPFAALPEGRHRFDLDPRRL